MFRKIVVPLDGSELAERALAYAWQLAAAGHAELVLLRVESMPAPSALESTDIEELHASAVEEAETYLARTAEALPPKTRVTTTVAFGRAASAILDVVEQTGADAVVMATHGRTGLPHLIYGSVAEAVLHTSPVPVLLVRARPGEAPVSSFHPATARVVVPLDGSKFAEAAVATAADLVGPTGELVVIVVVEPPQHVEHDEAGRVVAYLDQQEEARTRDGRDYLAGLTRRLRQRYPAAHITADVRVGEPAEGIVMATADHAADVVVMASHGRTGWRRTVLGSVTGAVLRTGPAPVLVIGPREAHMTTAALAGQHT